MSQFDERVEGPGCRGRGSELEPQSPEHEGQCPAGPRAEDGDLCQAKDGYPASRIRTARQFVSSDGSFRATWLKKGSRVQPHDGLASRVDDQG